MEVKTAPQRESLDYEEGYHKERHNNHFNDDYYTARAKIALVKFFKGFDISSKVLDYGCGMGQNIYLLPNATGYDISNFSVSFCRKKGIKATTNLQDIHPESFDIVLSSHSLEHHPHPKTGLEDIHSFLKENGILVLVLPYERHSTAKGKSVYSLDLNQHLYTWNFQNINNLLITTGFEIIENRYVRGAGYHRLLPLMKLGFSIYQFATNFVSRLTGIKEILVIAQKKG